MTAARVDLPLKEQRIRAWLHSEGLGAGPVHSVRPLAGGTQNVLVRLGFGQEDLVLRCPPYNPRPESASVISREIAVLGLLQDVDEVPTPRLRAASPDPGVVGAACYATDFVGGFNPAEGLPAPYASRLDWQAEIGLQMVDALAGLATVSIEPLVADGFRAPEGWLERQPSRWLKQLEGYGTVELLEAGRDLARQLAASFPSHWRPGLIHGDFHLGNILMHEESPRLAAVVDWELATIADPLLDLAHLLVGWPVGNTGSAHAGLEAPGLPDRAALLARYGESGGDVHDLEWYAVLAAFRLGVLLEGTHARARNGLVPAEQGERLHRLAAHLFESAHEIAAGGSVV